MTRKYYQQIAYALNGAMPREAWANKYQQWRYDVLALANAFEANNPGFDRDKFLKACGL